MKYFVYSLNRNDMETEQRSIPFDSYLRAEHKIMFVSQQLLTGIVTVLREREPTLDEAMRYASLSVINIVKQQVCSVTDIT